MTQRNEAATPMVKQRIIQDILRERVRQDQKWGFQSHPDGTGHADDADLRERFKKACDAQQRAKNLNWLTIAKEEFYEAAAEPSGSPELREELVQAMAVLFAWVEDIDTRER